MQLELIDITKSYKTKNGSVLAVDQLNWATHSGRVCGILGPNGSGKTTTIRILLDLLRPDSGEVRINGKSWWNRTEAFRQQIGYLPEERGLYKKDKALDVLLYAAALKGMSAADAKSQAISLLEKFFLSDFKYSPVESLSKGMAQKLQLAMTIIFRPNLVILDEPFSGLDPVNVKLVRETIQELKGRGALVLLSTHRMDEAERLCDDILMLHNGKVALQGVQREIREAHEVKHVRIARGIDLSEYRSVRSITENGEMIDVEIAEDSSSAEFLSELATRNDSLSELHITPVSLEELYLEAVDNK